MGLWLIDHFALGADSARASAGRRASLIDAREVQGALAVHHALGSTVWRVSNKILKAGAHSVVVDVSTLTVQSTGGWSAGV